MSAAWGGRVLGDVASFGRGLSAADAAGEQKSAVC